MQAVTYTIAVMGLSVVLGLCGQINLAQAAFFAIGAYAVGLGTVDFGAPFWLCLVAGMALAFIAGGLLGVSTLRLGGHYLAMVTISFQQILTITLINAPALTHGPDGVSGIGRPAGFVSTQSLSRARRSHPGVVGLPGLAAAAHPARPRDAGGARQRTRRQHRRDRRVPHQGRRLRNLRIARRPWRRPVRGRLLLCEPGPVRLLRFRRSSSP